MTALISNRADRGATSCILAILLLGFAACGPDHGYQSLAGRVRLNGEDLKEGTIQFYTTGEPAEVCAGAVIKDGKYEVPRDHGLKAGAYQVRISSPVRVGVKGGDGMNPFLSRETIPAKYNTQSTLTVEVRAGERGSFDFNLE